MKAFSMGVLAILTLLTMLTAQALPQALYLCKDREGTTRIRQLPCPADEMWQGEISQTPAPSRPSGAQDAKRETPSPEVSDVMQIIGRSLPKPEAESRPTGRDPVPLQFIPDPHPLTAAPGFIPDGSAPAGGGEQYYTLPPGYSGTPARPESGSAPVQRESYFNAFARGAAVAVLFFIAVLVVALVSYGWKAITRPSKQDTDSSIRKGMIKMNDDQKTICVVIAAVILAMGIYPPFHQYGIHGAVVNQGYGWIFAPPTATATVNIAMLLIQWIGVLIIGAIALVIAKE